MAYSLGIDLGTSKVAAVIIDTLTGKAVSVASRQSFAAISTQPKYAEQDPDKLFAALQKCLEALEPVIRQQVTSIGITGQMHGVLLWNSRDAATSNLITWQDQRCHEGDFISDLQKQCSDPTIRSGYGCATLAWLALHQPERLSEFNQATTIHDYLVCKLCGLEKGLSDPTDAASFGFYDLPVGDWDFEKIKLAGIPQHFMPKIVPCGSAAGRLESGIAEQWGLPEGVPVTAAIGDNQASLYATLQEPTEDIGLTLGTGGQLAVIVPSLASLPAAIPPSAEIRPYVENTFAVVAAALCGGNAWCWLPDTIAAWCKELGIASPTRDEMFAKLGALSPEEGISDLQFSPIFCGERYDPSLRGQITGISIDNFNLSNVAVALATGTLNNLKGMLPAELLKNKKRIIGSGNGLRKVPLMQKLAENIFELPLILSDAREEAAQGAAAIASSGLPLAV